MLTFFGDYLLTLTAFQLTYSTSEKSIQKGCYVYVNDKSVYNSGSTMRETTIDFTQSLTEGDSLRIDYYLHDSNSYTVSYTAVVTGQKTTFADLGFSTGIQYYNGSAWTILSGLYSTQLNLTSGLVFNSDSYLKYQIPATFIAYSGAPSNAVYRLANTSSIFWNDTHYYSGNNCPAYFSRSSSSSASIILTDGTAINMDASSYLNLYGSIQTAKTEAGLKTKGIYPAAGSTYDLGSTSNDEGGNQLKWRNVYADSFVGNLAGKVGGMDVGGVTVTNNTSFSESFTKDIFGTTSNGYFSREIRTQANAPSSLLGNFASGIAWKGGDTYGSLMVSYDTSNIRVCGGNGVNPVWTVDLIHNGGGQTINGTLTATKVYGAVAN